MSTDALRIKFHEELLAAKKDRLLFALGVVFLIPLLVPLIGLLFYVLLVYSLADARLTDHYPSLTQFCVIFTTFFFAVGFWQYRRTVQRPPPSDRPWEDALGSDFLRYDDVDGCGIALFFVFVSLPGFVFHLVMHVKQARRCFQIAAAEEVAFELLTAGGDGIPKAAIETAYGHDVEVTRSALLLLVEMKFVRARRKSGEIVFAHTMRAEDFLES